MVLGRRVVDAGDVVPGVGLQRGCAVADHVAAGAVGELEADVRGPRVGGGVELVADLGAGPLGDDRRIVSGERGRVDPGADGHAPGELQGRGIAEVHEVVDAVEVRPPLPYLPTAPAGAAGERAREAVPGASAVWCPRPRRRRTPRGTGGPPVPLATVTATGADVAELPAASRARALSCARRWSRRCVPGDRVGGGRVLGAEVGAVEQELDAGNPDIVGGVRGDCRGRRHGRPGRGGGHRDGRGGGVSGAGRSALKATSCMTQSAPFWVPVAS